MTAVPAVVTVELIEQADGRPIAYTDATGIAVFIHQTPEGTYVVDICTRDHTGEQLHVLVDGIPVIGRRVGSADVQCAPASTTSRSAARSESRRARRVRGLLSIPPSTPRRWISALTSGARSGVGGGQ